MADRDFPPRRPRGLGRRLDDIRRDLDEYYSGSAQGLQVPTEEAPFRAGRGALGLFPGGTDFGPYYIDPLPDDPMYYYRGPNFSTRIKAHQFVPDDLDIVNKVAEATESGTLNRTQMYDFNIVGTIYVRFIKNNSLWRYGVYTPIPLSEYRNFRNSASKGKSVKYLEQYGHGAASEGIAGVQI
jgi:hypothetical protein